MDKIYENSYSNKHSSDILLLLHSTAKKVLPIGAMYCVANE